MKKRMVCLALTVAMATSCCAFAAKYKVNTSGVIKSQSGKVITSPAHTVNQNYYNNFQAPTYINSNQVNATQVGTIEIVMDYSGSMSNWIGVAKRSMAAIVAQIPSTTKLGFRVFGYDADGNNPVIDNTVQQVKKIVKKSNGKFSVVTGASTIGKTTGACAATRQVAGVYPAIYESLSGLENAT